MNTPSNLPNLPSSVPAGRRDWSRVIYLPDAQEINACNRVARDCPPYVSGWIRTGDRQGFDGICADVKADCIPEGTRCVPVCFDLDYSALTGKNARYASVRKHVGVVGSAGFQAGTVNSTEVFLSVTDAVCMDHSGRETRLRARQLDYGAGIRTAAGSADSMQCQLSYRWKPGIWYRILLTCRCQANSNSVIEMWVCDLSTASWTFLFGLDLGAPDIRFRGDLALFLEGLMPRRAGDVRTMECRNICIHGGGSWHRLTTGDFSQQLDHPGSYCFGIDGDTFCIITTGVTGKAGRLRPQTRLTLDRDGTGTQGGSSGSKGKKHPLLTILLLVAAAWLIFRCINSPSEEGRAQSTSKITATTAAATSKSTATPRTQQNTSQATATPYLEWVDELFVVNDIILGHCLMNEESSFVFGVSQNARAGLTDEELYSAIYDIAFRWCNDDFRIGVTNRSDGIAEVYVHSAALRDGIRLGFATDLTPDEQQVLQQIRTVVAGLKRDHPNGELDIETAIYDYICAHMVYRSFRDFPEGDRRRKDCTSAVNAFLNGFGNCQAYSDLFYLMATEAGISVQYLAGIADGEGHLWNIVWIDGNNLMVDVTFGDTSMEGAPQPSHYWLNFGLDRAGDRNWLGQAFVYEFPAVTDERYTYYRNTDASTGYAASSLNDAVDYCVWKQQQGYSVAEVLMVNQSYSKKDIEKAFSRRAKRQYYYYYNYRDGNLLLHVVWK